MPLPAGKPLYLALAALAVLVVVVAVYLARRRGCRSSGDCAATQSCQSGACVAAPVVFAPKPRPGGKPPRPVVAAPELCTPQQIGHVRLVAGLDGTMPDACTPSPNRESLVFRRATYVDPTNNRTGTRGDIHTDSGCSAFCAGDPTCMAWVNSEREGCIGYASMPVVLQGDRASSVGIMVATTPGGRPVPGAACPARFDISTASEGGGVVTNCRVSPDARWRVYSDAAGNTPGRPFKYAENSARGDCAVSCSNTPGCKAWIHHGGAGVCDMYDAPITGVYPAQNVTTGVAV